MTSKAKWYSAQCIFLHTGFRAKHKYVYEERIILVRASSFVQALHRAERHAAAYVDSKTKKLGYVMVFELFDKHIHDGAEVFSLMYEDNLPPNKYIDKFYDRAKKTHAGRLK